MRKTMVNITAYLPQELMYHCLLLPDCVFRSTTMTGGSGVWWRRAVRWASFPAPSNWRTPVCCRNNEWDKTGSAPGKHERPSLSIASATQTSTPLFEAGRTWVTPHLPGNVNHTKIDKSAAVSHFIPLRNYSIYKLGSSVLCIYRYNPGMYVLIMIILSNI